MCIVKWMYNPNKMCTVYQGWRNRGGQGGHGPPKNLSGWAKVCFGPPKILTTGPLKVGVSGQTLSQIASEYPVICKIFKIFRLRRANMGRTNNSSAVDFFSEQISLPCNIP